MQIIELPLPEDIDKAITAVSSDKNGFILEAVRQRLKQF